MYYKTNLIFSILRPSWILTCVREPSKIQDSVENKHPSSSLSSIVFIRREELLYLQQFCWHKLTTAITSSITPHADVKLMHEFITVLKEENEKQEGSRGFTFIFLSFCNLRYSTHTATPPKAAVCLQSVNTIINIETALFHQETMLVWSLDTLLYLHQNWAR